MSQPVRSRVWPALTWLCTVVPGALLTLHGLAILPLSTEVVPLTAFQPFEVAGLAYTTPVPPNAGFGPRIPAEIAYEDGRPLPIPMGPGWGPVATKGRGWYYLGENILYLSTTDNSDPRSNGRTYTLRRPLPVSRRVTYGFQALAVLTTLAFLVWSRRAVASFFLRPRFAVVAALLFVLVAANRAWLFIDYPVAAIHPDSGTYFAVSEQITSGVWPNFGTRPPVYPLFLTAVFALADRVMAVVAAQTILSFLAGLTLVYGIYRWSPALALPAAGVTALFLFGFTTIEHDTAMLSESVYSSCLVLGFAALLAGLRDGSARWLGGASVAMALAILTRPAGMFLVVTYAIVAAWLLWRRFAPRAIVSFLLPFPLLLLSMSVYNLRVERAFAPTTWGEANLAVSTFLYWQTDPSYPPEINKDVERIQEIIRQRFVVTKLNLDLLYNSWDPDQLSPIFVQSFNADALNIAFRMGGDYETSARGWMRRISLDSIRKHPEHYAKFAYTMLYNYFTPARDFDFRVYLQNRVWALYVARQFGPEKGNAFMVRLAKEFADGTPPPSAVVTNYDLAAPLDLWERVVIAPTTGWRIYELTYIVRKVIFERWVWPLAVFAAIIASLVVLLASRGRHDAAFAVFIVSISALGAGLVVSLVEYSQPRYSYPMEWAYGASAVLLPLLFGRTAAGARHSCHVQNPEPAVPTADATPSS